MPLKERIITTAKAEASGVASLANQSLSSGAYLYPFRGLIYFLQHKNLWAPLTSRLAPMAALSVGVVTGMFVFTYIPQTFLLTFLNGPLAVITTIALVLSESAAIITTLSRSFLLDEALIDVFDAVLIQEGLTPLVSNGREVKSSGSSKNGISKLGKAVKKPFSKFTPTALITYLLYLPLNFIPIVGTVAFIFIQGRKTGPGYHARYFQLKNFSNDQREDFIKRNRPGYVAFGTVAMVLGMIPVVGIAVMFSNTVGAALWAADVEGGKNNNSGVKDSGRLGVDEDDRAGTSGVELREL